MTLDAAFDLLVVRKDLGVTESEWLEELGERGKRNAWQLRAHRHSRGFLNVNLMANNYPLIGFEYHELRAQYPASEGPIGVIAPNWYHMDLYYPFCSPVQAHARWPLFEATDVSSMDQAVIELTKECLGFCFEPGQILLRSKR